MNPERLRQVLEPLLPNPVAAMYLVRLAVANDPDAEAEAITEEVHRLAGALVQAFRRVLALRVLEHE